MFVQIFRLSFYKFNIRYHSLKCSLKYFQGTFWSMMIPYANFIKCQSKYLNERFKIYSNRSEPIVPNIYGNISKVRHVTICFKNEKFFLERNSFWISKKINVFFFTRTFNTNFRICCPVHTGIIIIKTTYFEFIYLYINIDIFYRI